MQNKSEDNITNDTNINLVATSPSTASVPIAAVSLVEPSVPDTAEITLEESLKNIEVPIENSLLFNRCEVISY